MTTQITPFGGQTPAPVPYTGFPPAASGGGSRGGTNPLVRLLSAFRRFKWLILGLTVVGGGVGTLATRYMPEKYVVSAAVFLEERGGDVGPVEASEFLSGQQWLELLRQPSVLDQVVRDQRLYIVGPNPGPGTSSREGPSGPDASIFTAFDLAEQFVPGRYTLNVGADGRSWELVQVTSGTKTRGTLGDSAGASYGFKWVPELQARQAEGSYSFTILTPREVTNQIRDALGTSLAPRGGRFVDITYDGTDPERARRTLNAILRTFVTQATQLKRRNLSDQTDALDSQLVAATQRLRDAETSLQNFKINTVTQRKEDVPVTPGLAMTTSATYGQYFQQREVLDSLRRERRELSEVLARAQTGDITLDQMLAIGVVRTSPELTRILTQISEAEAGVREQLVRYTEENPVVVSARQRVTALRTQTLPAYANAVIRRLDEDISSRESRVRNTEREMRDIPTRTITEQRLTREVDLARTTEAEIVKRAEIARLQEASSLPDLRILSEAVAPLEPAKNRKSVIIILGTLVGLGLGLGLAFVLDATDKRFRYMTQVSDDLGLTILGVVPEIKRAKGETPSAEEAAQVIEAFRTIRLNLSHVFPEDGPIALTISSPMPSDGKSLVSSNLALSFAEAGYRTILIDGDTRRGELHRTFGVERRPGLLDHLAGELAWRDALHQTSHAQLTLMTSGSRHRNGPELMGSRKMSKLMEELRRDFQVIIVDSPPLGAGIDPFVLGTQTGNLMLVVRAGATERDFAEAKLQIIDQLPIRMLGAVLNDVRSSMTEYKYYSYTYGYGQPDAHEEPIALPAVVTGPKS